VVTCAREHKCRGKREITFRGILQSLEANKYLEADFRGRLQIRGRLFRGRLFRGRFLNLEADF
jgi:hypothetical protein